jgi:hypothetical protein
MIRIFWCSIPFLFFVGSVVYAIHMALGDIPFIGYVGFFLPCIPLGFSLM